MKKTIIPFFLIIAALVFSMPAYAWYDNSYANKMQINVTNNAGANLTNFNLVINSSSNLSTGFDTKSLIAANKMQSNCNDMILVDSAETSEISYYIENNTCNTTNTIINAVANLTAGTNSFWIYYNNATKISSQDRQAVLDQLNPYFWYDFSEGIGNNTLDYGFVGNNGTLNALQYFYDCECAGYGYNCYAQCGDECCYTNYTTNITSWANARGYGLNFSNITDFVNTTNNFTNGNNTWTLSFWINPISIGEAYIFTDQAAPTNGMAFMNITINGTSGYGVLIGNSAADDWEFIQGIDISLLQWNFITITRNITNFTIYANGISAVSQIISSNLSPATSESFTFGSNPTHLSGYWDGLIDNFRAFMNYVQSPEEIKASYDGLAWDYGSEQDQFPPTPDTTAPQVIINDPTNSTYNSTNMTLNYIASDGNLSICIFENNFVNSSLPGCNNITYIGIEGYNEIKVFANDTSGNMNVSGVSYTITLPIPPVIPPVGEATARTSQILPIIIILFAIGFMLYLFYHFYKEGIGIKEMVTIMIITILAIIFIIIAVSLL